MSRKGTHSPLLVGPVGSEEVNAVIEWAITQARSDDESAIFAQGVLVSLTWLLGLSSWDPREVCGMMKDSGNIASLVAGMKAPKLAPRR